MTEIRPYRESDLGGVVDLWQACDLTRPWNPPAGDITFLRASGHGELLIAEEDGRIAGTVMVGHDGHRGWLYYVAVDPARRHQGLGGELVGAAERWLAACGVRKSMLLIRDTNTAVAAFYQAIGYTEEPRTVMSRWLDHTPR